MACPTPQEMWELAQSRETEFWRAPRSFDERMEQVSRRYAGALAEAATWLPGGARILDVGSGPTCAARLLPRGTKTYLDPLMPLFLQMHGRNLPVEGERICAMAESLPQPDASFDCVVCLDVLDQVLEPQQALAEMARVLKPGGLLVVGTTALTAPGAALRGFFDGWLARLRTETRPRYLTTASVEQLLEAQFAIRLGWRVHREPDALVPSLNCDTWTFLCQPQRAMAERDWTEQSAQTAAAAR